MVRSYKILKCRKSACLFDAILSEIPGFVLALAQRDKKARRSISAPGIRQKIDYLLCNFRFCLCGTLIHAENAEIFLFDH
jgi:hypothetical protein